MLWFFELVIYLFLLGDLTIIILSIYHFRQGQFRIKKLSWFILYLLVLLGAWGVIFYGSFVEPRRIVITEQAITLSTYQQKNLKVAFISDLHLGYYKNDGFAQEVAAKIKEQDPDIILMGGDYLLGDENNGQHMSEFASLTQKIPTFAVWGNHEYNVSSLEWLSDYTDKRQPLKDQFDQMGVHVLENSSLLLETDQGTFWLLGTDDIWAEKADLTKALAGTSNAYPKVLLTHNPDIITQAQTQGIDLVLAGHAHGGQIRLPLIGSVSFHRPIDLGRDYYQGLFDFDPTKLLVTSGLGEAGPRARLFNPPEIVMLDLQF